jgi:dTDP-4-dehydrorhamnose 3,5-epimerase
MKLGDVDGVSVQSLRCVPNERGALMEVARADDDWFPGFGQAYVTTTRAGVVKAWYRHRLQIDTIALVRGGIELGLFDDRAGSPSFGTTQVVSMSEQEPRLVVIPPMVWHGFQADSDVDAVLLHMNSAAFVLGEPDEERAPIDDERLPPIWSR